MTTTSDKMKAWGSRQQREAAILADYKARGLEPIGGEYARGADWSVGRLPFAPTKRGRQQLRRDPEDRETGPGSKYANGPEEVMPRFGMHYISGNSGPYFSLTGDVRAFPSQRRDNFGGGCCHDTIVEAYPGLAPLVPWHLADQSGEPMHYRENALYAFRKFRGLQGGTLIPSAPYKDEDRKAWAHAVLAGVLDDVTSLSDWDECRMILEHGKPESVRDWLNERAPKLRACFLATMERFRVPLMPGHLEEHALELRPDGSASVVRRDWVVPIGTDARNPCIPYADRPATVAGYSADEVRAFRLKPKAEG